ncbi:MATE family efflux transporter [Ligilactobacillus faecis]|uniref:Probable multidrug resistance protein NorM n=1 Tax=Ligilactobacillus faecis TaxID=762833 RepID=A0ABV4DRB1_9LACO
MEKQGSFTQGAILGSLLKFTFPVLLALLLQALYTAVDLMIVGQFSDTSQISAVATGSQLMQTLTSLVTSLAMGITISIGQTLGQKRADRVSHIIMNSLLLFFGLALILTGIVVIFAPQLARLLNAPTQAFDATVAFLQISGAGAIFIVGYNLVGGIFRGLGDSITPLITVAIASVLNILGDLLLVAHFHLGAAGAAAATVFAQSLSLLFFFLLKNKKEETIFDLKEFKKPDFKVIKQIFTLGSPIALQDFLINCSFVIILAIANSLGVVASAGIGVGEKATAFIMLLPLAFMQSMAAFVAQNVGARQHLRAKKALFYGMGCAFLIAVIMAYICFFHGDLLARIFTHEQAVIQATQLYMRSYAFDVLLTAIFFCFVGYFNGYGKTRFVMIQGLIGALLFRIPLSFLFSSLPHADLFTLGMATPASSLVQVLLCFGYYLYLQKQNVIDLKG